MTYKKKLKVKTLKRKNRGLKRTSRKRKYSKKIVGGAVENRGADDNNDELKTLLMSKEWNDVIKSSSSSFDSLKNALKSDPDIIKDMDINSLITSFNTKFNEIMNKYKRTTSKDNYISIIKRIKSSLLNKLNNLEKTKKIIENKLDTRIASYNVLETEITTSKNKVVKTLVQNIDEYNSIQEENKSLENEIKQEINILKLSHDTDTQSNNLQKIKKLKKQILNDANTFIIETKQKLSKYLEETKEELRDWTKRKLEYLLTIETKKKA
jgi:hypothetical protein